MIFDTSIKITKIRSRGSTIHRINFKFLDEQYSVQEANDKLYLRILQGGSFKTLQVVDLQSGMSFWKFCDFEAHKRKLSITRQQLNIDEIVDFLNSHFSEEGQQYHTLQRFKDRLRYNFIQDLRNFIQDDSYYIKDLPEGKQQKIISNIRPVVQQLQNLLNDL